MTITNKTTETNGIITATVQVGAKTANVRLYNDNSITVTPSWMESKMYAAYGSGLKAKQDAKAAIRNA